MEATMTKPITNTASPPACRNTTAQGVRRLPPTTHHRPKTFVSHFRTDSRQILSHPLRRLAIVLKLLCRIFGQILAKFYRIQPGHVQTTPFRASDTITSSLNFPTTYPYKPATDLDSGPLYTQQTTPIQQS